MAQLEFSALSFEDLTPLQVHQMLNLRSEVFVMEQVCVYQDPDPEDSTAIHLLGYAEKDLAAYARIYCDQQNVWHIGRIIVAPEFRNHGFSSSLMEESLNLVLSRKASHIQLSAQAYLEGFYNRFGFEAVGNLYLEDGIPHLRMIYQQSFKTAV